MLGFTTGNGPKKNPDSPISDGAIWVENLKNRGKSDINTVNTAHIWEMMGEITRSETWRCLKKIYIRLIISTFTEMESSQQKCDPNGTNGIMGHEKKWNEYDTFM